MKPGTLLLQPSRILLVLLTCAALFFSAMLFLVPLPSALRLAILFLILAATIYFSLRDALLKLTWSFTSLNINAQNQLQLVRKNGKRLEVSVQENTVVTPYLTVLNCQLNEAVFLQRLFTHHVLILPDTADAEAYRRLRVWLRWAKRRAVEDELVS